MKEKYQDELNNFLRVRAYLRYSSTMQDDGFSIEYQMSEINEYLSRKGMELSKTHIDKAHTATKVAGREAFHELVRDVKEGLVDVVIVFKMNRMFRNSEESQYYRRIFRKHNVKLISVTENIDDSTSSGRLTTSILSNIDQYQSEIIADHVRASLREMAKQGLYTGRPLLIGYGLEDVKHGKKKRKKFVINEEEAPFIRRIFEMYASGMSCKTIGKTLKAEGIKTRKGVDFSQNTLRRMLNNDFYIGTYRYKVVGYDEIVIEDCVPAIISKELFAAAQRQAKENDPRLKQRHGRKLYALTGKMICGKCGGHYIGTNTRQKITTGVKWYFYYTCTNRKHFASCDCLNVRKEWAEEKTMNEIRKHILNKEQIEILAEQISAMCENSPSQITDEIAKLKAEQAKIEKRYNKFVSAFFDDENEAAEDLLAKKTLKQMKSELRTIIKKIGVLTEQLRYTVTPNNIKKYLYEMLEKSKDDNIEMWNEIFNNFVEKVVVTDNDINVHLRVYPTGNISDSNTMALPNVTLSETIERPEKYRPKRFSHLQK